MTTTITYEQTPPRRPTLDDLHGGQIIDDTEFPPDPGDPNAAAMNQSDELVIAAHSVLWHSEIYIAISGGTPSKASLASLRTDLALSDFTLVDGGAGITDITHTGGKLPTATMPAWARGVGDVGDTVFTVETIANGWRVKARTAGTLTDNKSFVLMIYGAGL